MYLGGKTGKLGEKERAGGLEFVYQSFHPAAVRAAFLPEG